MFHVFNFRIPFKLWKEINEFCDQRNITVAHLALKAIKLAMYLDSYDTVLVEKDGVQKEIVIL